MHIAIDICRTIAHLLLEKLDKHLWAARPAALGPQLLAMYKSKHSEQQQHTDVMETTPTLLPIPAALKVHIEDSISNWGARAESEKYVRSFVLILIMLQ